MSYSERVPAAERAILILELLAGAPDGLRAGQLEEKLEIPRSALFALLNTLTSLGYVEQPVSRGPYQLGPRLATLLQPKPPGKQALILAFHEELERHSLGETTAVVTLDRNEVLVLSEAACDRMVRSVMPAGQRRPLLESAAGLVLLAGMSTSLRHRRLDTVPEDLPPTLNTIRQQGVARCERSDVIELAVPICEDGRRPTAALLVSVPAFRWTHDEETALLAALRETAARISYRLGAVAYQPYGHVAARRLGPTVEMQRDELQQFLDGPWAARLACLREDGTPHVVPVWYEWTEEAFVVAAWPGSLWAEYLLENPSVALTIDESWPPMRRVLARGRANVVRADLFGDGMNGLFCRLSARYLGAPAHMELSVPDDPEQWRAFRIVPDVLTARREVLEVEG